MKLFKSLIGTLDNCVAIARECYEVSPQKFEDYIEVNGWNTEERKYLLERIYG